MNDDICAVFVIIVGVFAFFWGYWRGWLSQGPPNDDEEGDY